MTDYSFDTERFLATLGSTLSKTILYQFACTEDGIRTYTYISGSVAEITGLDLDLIRKKPELLYEGIEEKDFKILSEKEAESFQTLNPFEMELQYNSKPSGTIWLRIRSVPERRENGTVVWSGIMTDITEDKRLSSHLEKSYKELGLLNTVNDLILSHLTVHELLESICKCLVENGGYVLAWIAYVDPKSDWVVSDYSYGKTEYLKSIQINLSDPIQRKGPTASVLLGQPVFITNNFSTSETFIPWKEKAGLHGISSSAVFGIDYGNIRYALNVYSSAIDAFDNHEVTVLYRLTRNLERALQNSSLEAEREFTKYQLNERIKELKSVHQIGRLLRTKGMELNAELLSEMERIIPTGMQFPEICEAEIRIEGIKEGNSLFSDRSIECIRYSFTTANNRNGEICVGYLPDKVRQIAPLYLKEEYDLIRTISGMLVDFHDQWISTKNLAESEGNIKTILENTATGFILLNAIGTIMSFNHPLAKIFDAIPETGQKFLDYANKLPGNLNLILPGFLEQSRSGKKQLETEVTYSLNKQSFTLLVSVNSIFAERGFMGHSISISDISHIRQFEYERSHLTSDLIRRNKDLEDFAYIVSHNIRAPLANILGLTNLITNKQTEKDFDYCIDALSKSAQSLDLVISDLNEILKVKNLQKEDKTTLDLNQITDLVLARLDPLVKEVGAEIQIDFSKVPEIFAGYSGIESILHQLISNSLRYSDPLRPSIIQIWSDLNSGNFELHVADNGLGIDLEKHRSRLFKLYKRFHPKISGKGIGLFLVKNQVNDLGGIIDLVSKPGIGTEIIIKIPLFSLT